MLDHTKGAPASESIALEPSASPDFFDTRVINGVPTSIRRRIRPAPKAEVTASLHSPVEIGMAKANELPSAAQEEIASAGKALVHIEPEPNSISVLARPDDYEVGFAKPPKHTQFKKGQSGNASGRPNGSKNASTIATDQLNKPLRVKIDGKSKRMSALEIAIQQQMKRALEKSDLKALSYMLQLSGQGPSAAGSGTKGAYEKGPTGEAADPVDMEILAFSSREHMIAAGLSEDMADSLLLAMGLKPATEK